MRAFGARVAVEKPQQQQREDLGPACWTFSAVQNPLDHGSPPVKAAVRGVPKQGSLRGGAGLGAGQNGIEQGSFYGTLERGWKVASDGGRATGPTSRGYHTNMWWEKEEKGKHLDPLTRAKGVPVAL
ncbi:hypothetical protein MMC11_000294 [Xylographa trunciseda]|nr:hypothetical protein [Xylographa trunciseda]